MTEHGARPVEDEEAVHHLSESDLSGFLDRDLAPDQRRRVEIHLDQCTQCRGELIEARRVVDAYARPRSLGTVLRSTRRWWVPAAMAAGLATLLLVPRRTSAPLSPRDSTRAAAVVDGEGTPRIDVVSPDENATVAPNAAVLIWRPTTADEYRVVLLTESGDPVWTRETTDTTVRLPETALRSGQTYFWRVDAIANGISATTGVHRLQLRP